MSDDTRFAGQNYRTISNIPYYEICLPPASPAPLVGRVEGGGAGLGRADSTISRIVRVSVLGTSSFIVLLLLVELGYGQSTGDNVIFLNKYMSVQELRSTSRLSRYS